MFGLSDPRPSAPQKFSTSSTSSYLTSSHYDHELCVYSGYLNHVDLLMPHLHVLKKQPYCLMYTWFVLWILSCAQLTNKCSKLTNSFLVNVVALSTAKTTNSEKATYFLTLMSCSANKVLHLIHRLTLHCPLLSP